MPSTKNMQRTGTRAFVRGLGCIFGIAHGAAPHAFGQILTPTKAMAADRMALAGDWQRIGLDFRSACAKFEASHGERSGQG